MIKERLDCLQEASQVLYEVKVLPAPGRPKLTPLSAIIVPSPTSLTQPRAQLPSSSTFSPVTSSVSATNTHTKAATSQCAS